MGLKESGLRGSLRNVSVGIRAIPDSDLYYTIDEGEGDIVNDQIGDNNGVSTGSLVWVEDASVGHEFYVELDGTNYIEVQDSTIISDNSDFTVGIEIEVGSEGLDDCNIWNWGNGSRTHAIGASSGNIGSNAFDGSSQRGNPAHPEPEAPYNINLVYTWDASTETPELYLDETSSTTTENSGGSTSDGLAIGADTIGSNDMGGAGVARFAHWDEIVDPSEFTL